MGRDALDSRGIPRNDDPDASSAVIEYRIGCATSEGSRRRLAVHALHWERPQEFKNLIVEMLP